jgi:general stress protein 26
MVRLTSFAFTGAMAQDIRETTRPFAVELDLVKKVVGRRSFCLLSTVSANDRPHAAGLIYVPVGTTLYVNTFRGSRKARNIATNPHVGVVVPVRRMPIGPPSAVQYQATAEILDREDPHVVELMKAGTLKAITSHGELDNPDACFLRITPSGRIHTYGLGMPLLKLIRDPLNGAGVVAGPLRDGR